MNGACYCTFFCPAPMGPWGGAKTSNIIQYHKISITKLISKIFQPNFVCLLTNERYKTYQMGFTFSHLGHAQGVGLGGTIHKILIMIKFITVYVIISVPCFSSFSFINVRCFRILSLVIIPCFSSFSHVFAPLIST